MPTRPRDGEKIYVGVDISQDVQRRMVLEEQIHLNTNAPDVLEHVRGLHMLRVGAEPIKAGKSQLLLLFTRGQGGSILTYHGHRSGRRTEPEQTTPSNKAGQNDWCNNGNKHEKRPPHALLSTVHFCEPLSH